MSDCKITFIIPSVDRPTLTKALESLIQQTDENWKAIVVFDGIATPSIVSPDERITLLSIEKTGVFGQWNGNAGLVRNEGIKRAETQWVGFLDDDDTLDKDYVKDFYELSEDPELGLILWKMQYTNTGQIVPNDQRPLEFGNVGISFCYSIKNEQLDPLFDRNLNGEDWELFAKIRSVSKFIASDKIRYYVR